VQLACSITIREAFGTSTPTSITVVLTNTPIWPLVNSAITAFFSGAVNLECSSPTDTPGSAALSWAWVSVALLRSSASLSSISGQTQ
jgi:hypothetical protein